MSDLVENLLLLFYVKEEFTDAYSTGLIFGIFVLFDVMDRVSSGVVVAFNRTLVSEEFAARRVAICAQSNFLVRVVFELIQSFVCMYFAGFEQNSSIVFVFMFILQTCAIIIESRPQLMSPAVDGDLARFPLDFDVLNIVRPYLVFLLKLYLGGVLLIPQLHFSDDTFLSIPYQACLTIFLWVVNFFLKT